MYVGGLGTWSNENCKMIPCPGDPDDDQVCCECNQTVRQRLSRRQSSSLTAHPIGHFGLLLVRIEMGKETVNACVESFVMQAACCRCALPPTMLLHFFFPFSLPDLLIYLPSFNSLLQYFPTLEQPFPSCA